ncbi:sensor histidine kinase [Kineococcus rubinsiae]|uniref:sensor histidine kinase n=1 Tax=Kineococcus rubinsiae TaxID=2609562 RepID=UPI0014306B09|nr:histidine kinase [Kineococcus rubinsiae]
MRNALGWLGRPWTGLLVMLVVLLAAFDGLVITPGWPYAVVFGVPALAGASLAIGEPHRRDALAVAAVLLSLTGTSVLAGLDYRYLGTWGLTETAVLLLLLASRWRSATGRKDRVLMGSLVVAVLAQSLREDVRDAPLYAALLAVGVTAAAATGIGLRAVDSQQRMLVAAVRRAERQEIARELHDVVAHHVTGMVVATQAARTVLTATPGQAPAPVVEALSSVEIAGTEALAAMRRLVGVLRTDPTPGAHRLPTPRLADVTGLVGRFRAAGAADAVELQVDGDGTGLLAEVQAGVYRVVQESLTNVQRHARGAALVRVQVRCTGAGVGVRVLNTRGRADPTPTPAGGGFGVVGMRERVTALGGTLTAGPHEGGWVVDAVIPAGAVSPDATTRRSRSGG